MRAKDRDTLEHWTTTTGDMRKSKRSEVSAETMRELIKPLDKTSMYGVTMTLPRPFGLYHLARVDTVFARGAAGFTLQREARIILEMTIGRGRIDHVAWDLAWRYTAEGDKPGCPQGRWIADRIDAGILNLPINEARQIMEWTGDMTRCIAWTSIEHVVRPTVH